MKWSQLPDKLTTEQVIEFASNMHDGEDITVSTPITDFLTLDVSMGNEPLEGVGASLVLGEVDGMYGFMPLEAFYGGIVPSPDEPEESRKIVGGEFVSQDVCLNIHDVIRLFRLGDSTRWEITNHGAMVG
jgi:hypothetical protein